MKENSYSAKPYNSGNVDEEETPFKRLRKGMGSRDQKEPTQEQLSKIFSDELGVQITQSKISELENGRLKRIPDIDVLYAYSHYFGVSTDYLLGFTEMRSINLEMKRTSFVTGLSEKSLIVLDYLRKFKGQTNTATGLINYSTISCLNRIIEAYYPSVMQSMENYCDDTKRINVDCSVDTLFSMIDDYFNAKTAKCNGDKEVTFTRNNTSYSVNIEKMYEILSRENVLKEIDRIKDMKGGDADDLT